MEGSVSREEKSRVGGMEMGERFGIHWRQNGRPRAAAGQATSAEGSVEQGAQTRSEAKEPLVTSAEGHSADLL